MIAGRPLLDWAKAVQDHAEREHGYHLVRGLGGHGYGRTLHGAPFISNVVPRRPGEWPDAWVAMKPGMLLAVEPMLALGTADITADSHAWPIFTADGSISVHYEANILITEDGPEDLTEGLDMLPDIIG
jgi:methionyl aminopeptidase